jgi:hypothetical protein
MNIRQLMKILETMNPESEVVVAFFYADSTSEIFNIEDVTSDNGNVRIEIYEEEPGA